MQLVHKTVVFPAAKLHSGGDGGGGAAIARRCGKPPILGSQSSAIIKSGALARF